MKKSYWQYLKNKWVIAGLIVLIIIVLIIWARSGSSAPTFETAAAQIGNVIETVSVTGTISPIAKANLAFEKGGVISRIYVKVGDAVKRGDLIASLDSGNDQAALASAEASLADLSRGLTPEELAVQKTSLDNAKKDALNAAHDGLVKAQNALFNYTDAFFSNPQSSNPTLYLRTDTVPIQTALNQERLNVTGILNQWSADLSNAALTPANLISRSNGYLSTVKNFMTDLSVVVNALNPGNSSMTQVQINAVVAAMNSGLSVLNTATDSVTAAQTGLSTAQSNYDLKLAGNSAQSIAALTAKVAQAQALLDEDTLISPIDGVVTKADPDVGEYFAPGQSGFAVQNNDFKIEAYVPEADIAKVSIGDLASSTLDAYGSDTDFPAKVIMIDPAETVLEGVPTYKVTLVFVQPDSRIRSGMTANLEILTHERDGVLEIPYRAVTDTNGSKTVRLANPDGKTYATVSVVTGLKGSYGTIEIVSGLSVGDKVVTYVK